MLSDAFTVILSDCCRYLKSVTLPPLRRDWFGTVLWLLARTRRIAKTRRTASSWTHRKWTSCLWNCEYRKGKTWGLIGFPDVSFTLGKHGITMTRIPATGIHTGIVHLYFGCRNEVDFLHKSQLETLEQLQWGGHSSWVSKLVNPQNGWFNTGKKTKSHQI